MGVPSVPLGELYGAGMRRRYGNVTTHLQTPVSKVLFGENEVRGVCAGGRVERADYYVSALPVDRASELLAPLRIPAAEFGRSPITGIHLWFDRPVTELPHAVLLDGVLHWMFNKRGGRYLLVVVSASRSLVDKSRAEVIEETVRELAAYLPAVREARLEKAHVVKEVKATFLGPGPAWTPCAPARGRATGTSSWQATGPAPAGPPPWKVPCAAATWQQRPSPRRPASEIMLDYVDAKLVSGYFVRCGLPALGRPANDQAPHRGAPARAISPSTAPA
jgi:zeta-carotene desaturase